MGKDRFYDQLTDALRVLTPRAKRSTGRAVAALPPGWALSGGDPARGYIGWHAEHAATLQTLGPFDTRAKAVAAARRAHRKLVAATERIDERRASLGRPPLEWPTSVRRGGKPRTKRPTQLALPLGRPARKPRQLQLPLRMKFDAASIIAGAERLKPGQVPPAGWQISGSVTVGYYAVHRETGATRGPFQTRADALEAAWRLGGKRRGGKSRIVDGSRGWRYETIDEKTWLAIDPVTDERTGPWASLDEAQAYAARLIRSRVGSPYESRAALTEFERWKANLRHRGGKRRFDPAQLAKGTAAELEHAATIKKIVRRKLPVKQAAAEIAKDHLREAPAYYDRLAAVEVPKRKKGLKAPRLKLLHRSGRLRVYLVDSHKVRRQLPDWTMGGHGRVYFPQVPRNEVWIAEEVFDPERALTTIHELNEYTLMGGGMDYDTAHDKSTALEQEFRVGGRKDVAATLRRKLKEAAASCV